MKSSKEVQGLGKAWLQSYKISGLHCKSACSFPGYVSGRASSCGRKGPKPFPVVKEMDFSSADHISSSQALRNFGISECEAC